MRSIFFFAATASPKGSCGHAKDAVDDAKDAAAGCLSRPMIAAARQRVHGRLGHLLSAPPRLTGIRESVWLLPRSVESSIKYLAAAEKAAETMPPMVPVLAVELAALCSNESSAGQL